MPNYPLDFLIYSVGKHPKYFLKLVAKYDGVLNPTMVLTSATVYRPSFSSLAASLKRILRMKSMVDSPVIAFNFRCRGIALVAHKPEAAPEEAAPGA